VRKAWRSVRSPELEGPSKAAICHFPLTLEVGEPDASIRMVMMRPGALVSCVPGGLSQQNSLDEKEAYNHLEEREYGTFPNYAVSSYRSSASIAIIPRASRSADRGIPQEKGWGGPGRQG